MNVKDALWKLHQVAECSVLDASTREAAKLATDVLNGIFLQFNMRADAPLTELQARVYELAEAERNRTITALTKV